MACNSCSYGAIHTVEGSNDGKPFLPWNREPIPKPQLQGSIQGSSNKLWKEPFQVSLLNE